MVYFQTSISLWKNLSVHLPAEHSPCEVGGEVPHRAAVNAINGFNAITPDKTLRRFAGQMWSFLF